MTSVEEGLGAPGTTPEQPESGSRAVAAPTLIEKLQSAAAGSRNLDAEVFGSAVLAKQRGGLIFPDERPDAPGGIALHVPHYTTSLDAIVSLIGREWGPMWSVSYDGAGYRAEAQAFPCFVGRHAAPPIALCIAFLRTAEATRATTDSKQASGMHPNTTPHLSGEGK